MDQAILDNEVITSPENISLLAKEHLNIDLVSYKRSQIKQLNYKTEKITKIDKVKKEKIINSSTNIKTQVVKKIKEKRKEIKKLQELYSNPKSIPGEIKIQVARQIEKKKIGLNNIYEAPKDLISFEKVGRWGAIQVVKAFLGMPLIPGR